MEQSERIKSYYFSLKATGNESIDRMLRSFAGACSMFHNTADWEKETVTRIQDSIDISKEEIEAKDTRIAELEKELALAVELIEQVPDFMGMWESLSKQWVKSVWQQGETIGDGNTPTPFEEPPLKWMPLPQPPKEKTDG